MARPMASGQIIGSEPKSLRSSKPGWEANHEVHESLATGPFCGHRDDQFAVLFELDATFKPSGERIRMREVALYTVAGDRIVQEEFLYLAT